MKNPVIFDVDTGVDDAVAIILALKHRCPIQFFCSCNGNIDAKQAAKNTLDILELIKAPNIPVVVGSEDGYKRTRTKRQVHGKNGIGDFVFPKNTRKVSRKNYLTQYYETIMNAKRKIDIIALGPLTNIAKLLDAHPDCENKINSIYFMGSSFDKVKGETPYAGFNVACDPEATERVLNSSIDLIFCPNNFGRELHIRKKDYKKLNRVNRIGHAITFMINHYNDHFVKDGASLYDSTAVYAYMTKVHKKIKNVNIQVKYFPKLDTGIAIPNFKKKPNAKIVTKISKTFFARFVFTGIIRCYDFNEDFVFRIEQIKEKIEQRKKKNILTKN